MDNYFARYLPLLVHIILVAGIAIGMVLLSAILGKHRPNPVKSLPYECGMLPTGDSRGRFSVGFYLVAMLFILFDVEAVFLYPWAVVYRQLLRQTGQFAFWEMLLYIGLMFAGFFYIWKKGILDWNKPESSG